jgi:hypothetical protein
VAAKTEPEMRAAPLQLAGALKPKLRHSRGKLADAIN